MLSLQKEYVRVLRDGRLSYGGSQSWSENKTVKLCGCGPVAVLDLVLYLSGKQEKPISLAEYNRELEKLSRSYLPLIRPFGINGLMLAAGANLLLRKYKLPYTAFWAVSGKKFWPRLEELLAQDIPVVFSVGPNFPAIWQNQRLQFYGKRADGSYYTACTVKSHYITVTGCDESWLRISSWGREYYIKRAEYDSYIREHSAALVSNILMLRRNRR